MNTINHVNNVSFSSRYINMKQLEDVPPRISEAILKSEAIDKFLNAGKPKTFWGKILDIFKKDQFLNVYHNTSRKANNHDPFAKDEFVYFEFDDSINKGKTFTIKSSQEGIKRQAGSVPKPGEHHLFKAPEVTSTEKIAKIIEEIKDFGKLLK